MNMTNELRRAVLKFERAYESRIKRASVYLHDQEAENAISESIFEDRSRPPVRHRTALFPRLARFFFLAGAATAISAAGVDLKSETVQQWEDYVKAADTRHTDRLSQCIFLLSDEVAGQTTKLRNGGVVVTPASQHVPLKVRSGLIHDWTGAAFIPNAKFDDVLPVLRDYDRYKDYYRPSVVYAKRIATSESKDQFSMVLMNKSAIARTALDTDYQTVYTQIDDHRWLSVTDATRIQEIAEYDTPSQHLLPENHGTGLIWRLHSITRFEERDGGVYIEVEVIALSRDIPTALRWVVEPIVRRVSRNSLATSLQQTEAAVRSRSTPVTAGNARLADPGNAYRPGGEEEGASNGSPQTRTLAVATACRSLHLAGRGTP